MGKSLNIVLMDYSRNNVYFLKFAAPIVIFSGIRYFFNYFVGNRKVRAIHSTSEKIFWPIDFSGIK